MKEVKFDNAAFEELFRQAEAARALKLAGAKNVWSHTRAEGVLDGVCFQLCQSEIEGLKASFVLHLNKDLTEELARGITVDQRMFDVRFSDLFQALVAIVAPMGYFGAEVEFGHDLRFRLRNYNQNGKNLQDPAAALERMRSDAPKIQLLFDVMCAEAMRRIAEHKKRA